MDIFSYSCFLIASALTVFIMMLFGCLYAYLVYLKWIYRHIPGPSPEWHFLGNVRKLRECTKKGRYYHFQFLQWAEEYGTLYKVFLFHKVMLVTTDTAVTKKILTNSWYQKSRLIYTRVSKACSKRFLGSGLVTNFNHEKWKQRRSCVNPAFQKRYLTRLIGQFNRVADTWIERLQELSHRSSYVDMSDMLARVTVDTIGKVGFRINLKTIDSEHSKFLDSIYTVLEGMSIANKDPLMMYRWKYSKKIKAVQDAVHYVRSLSRQEIERRLDGKQENTTQDEDILSLLIKSKDCIPDLNIEDIVDDFVTIFVAGQETTANALSFLFAEVGRNKEIFNRMQKEVSKIVGKSDFVTQEHINQLQFMTQVIKETLRLYPPAPATVRDLPANSTLEGYKIPRDSSIIFPFFVIHRMPQYYYEPEKFNPDRWASDKPRQMYSYLPFSLGQRSCAGQQFAMIESKILLCKFLQNFKYTLDPTQSLEIEEVTTLKVKGGTRMILSNM